MRWLQQLHSDGLLSGSFRPSDDIGCLRTYLRHRTNLVNACGEQIQHMQRALDQMNIHLHLWVSDLDGETGLRIVDAILAGQRSPKELVKLRDPRIRKSTVEEMEAALEGDWREEHLFVLRQALQTYRFLQQRMAEGDDAIEKLLQGVEVNPSSVPEEERPKNPVASQTLQRQKKKKRGRQRSQARFDRGIDPDLRSGFDQNRRAQRIERADPHLGDRCRYEPLAECQSVLFVARAVSWQ